MIQIRQLSKVYYLGSNTIHALRDINLDIGQHEFTAIIGPSGSGKSTLMNMLGCLDTPSAGTYQLDGVEVSRLSDDRLADIRNRKIGFVFQGFNLLHKLNALENVELPLVYQGVGARIRRHKAMEALERVGLGDRIYHRPSELSGGQQQRVAIARAIAGEPPVLLADEPTGNLDSKSGVEIMQILKQLHQNGSTVILITHDPNIAGQTDRIIHIQDGEIVDDRRAG